MITTLIILLVVALIIQPSKNRFQLALAFVGGVLIHEFFYSELEGFAYHASSALVCSASLIVILYLPYQRLSLFLSSVLLAMIAVEVAGYFLWFYYYPPIYYNSAIGMLFIAAIYYLCKGSVNYAGKRDTGTNYGGSYILGNISSRYQHIFKSKA